MSLLSSTEAEPLKSGISKFSLGAKHFVERKQEQGFIGVRTDQDRKVARVRHFSPADIAGVLKDDRIIDVDGNGKDAPLIGPVGTEVTFTVERFSKHKRSVHTFTVKRCSFSEIKELERRFYYSVLSHNSRSSSCAPFRCSLDYSKDFS